MPPCVHEDSIPHETSPRGVVDVVSNFSAETSTTRKDSAAKPTPLPPQRKATQSFTIAQVASHNTRDDAWLIYKNQVLDVTKWIGHHPGGEQTLLRFAGMDATDELRSFHDDWVLESKLPHFVIGTVSDAPETTELVEDFRKLGEEFDKLGYFHVSRSFYVSKIAAVFSIFSCSMALLFKTEYFAAHMASAVLLGIFWQQFAFVGHDCGHMSARTHARDKIDVPKLGALVTFFNGISVSWWNATHNVHHAVPNTVDCDPDIAHLPVIALDKRMFGSLFNKYHGRVMEFDWAARNIFVPYQHLWYYPIMCVARFNLYIQSVLFLVKTNDGHGKREKLNMAAFVGYFGWFILLVFSIPTWFERVAFVLLSHAVAGLLNVQITLSHFPRPIFDSPNKEDGGVKYGGDFYTRNVIASLDVECPTYLDWFHGGLQFQTLHHLYPRLGREHLRKTEPLIASLCKKHSLPYSRMSFIKGNMEVCKTLKDAALKVRTWSPLIYESMCAQG
mmetsp:Transcript_1926/g.3503  ORF Transcript_1926/g.3503 Transcript_1926/m.3503 type:complete len:502 (+) Transcript_1926:166-1671(+)|eukprot:CAMPEP_0196137184 /NCGR_PEP_ID=MMETSP0910-20130528/5252_1 /TAXON_ID=49265 /ORGANISM="Thalassiosira rotula, Strain GSO102" /LENGTH=501 /DNA_ID=CAMNT_0041397611 /DNA_START=95 /DNA_END=1600 /DNA_ORIENTATION=+